MLPILGAAPIPPFIMGHISGNYEQISMKFSVITLLTSKREICKKKLKYVTPSWSNPTPTTPVGHTIPHGIVIFLVFKSILQ